ncbi:MAG: hypothetical protein ACTHJ6_16945 [Oryzihumus sp.]
MRSAAVRDQRYAGRAVRLVRDQRDPGRHDRRSVAAAERDETAGQAHASAGHDDPGP